MCEQLPDAWTLTAERSPESTVRVLARAFEDQHFTEESLPFQPTGRDDEHSDDRDRERRASLGAAVVYDHALGPLAGQVIASGIGGSAWMTRELNERLGFRLSMQYSRVDGVPTTWESWSRSGELSASTWRIHPDGRVALSPTDNIELAALAGPAAGVFERTIRLSDLTDTRREFTLGLHAAGEAIIWTGDARRTGILIAVDGAAFMERSDATTPIVQAGARLGLVGGGER
mgnify:CR=1 FL=1